MSGVGCQASGIRYEELTILRSLFVQLIKLTRDEINRSRLMIELRNGFGTVTPEMSEVVSGVRNVLFGEEDGLAGGEAVPPAGTFPAEYRSPLED